ncbi:MAG: hypothetical protein AAF389_14945 [Gemmatimonadota bacterium]
MADFKIQRGTTSIATSATTATITAGVDYDAPSALSAAFIRIVGTHLTGAAPGNATLALATIAPWISNPGNLLTSITFERFDGNATWTAEVAWEIVEYIGAGGGDNEFIVRAQGVQALGTADDAGTTAAIGSIGTDADVVPWITGQGANNTGVGSAYEALHTSEWNAGADTATFTRHRTVALASNVSYAIIEFTGANWAIQRAEHGYDGDTAGTAATETITTLGSTARAFLHVQQRSGGDAQCDTQGQEVWISSTTQVSFLLDSGASIGTGSTEKIGVAWVIENTQSSGQTMVVQRYSGTHSSGTSGFSETVTEVGALDETSIEELTATLNQSTSSSPRQFAHAELTTVTNVDLYRGSDTADLDYRFATVEWPAAPTGASVVVDPGAVTIAMTDVGLTVGKRVEVDPGAVVVAMTDVTLTYNGTIGVVVDPGAVTIAMTDVFFGLTRTVDPFAVTITGTDVALSVGRDVVVDPGSVAIAGTDVALEHNRTLSVDPGSVAIAGTDVEFRHDRHVDVESGSVALSFTDVTLSYNAPNVVVVDPGTVTIDFTDVGLSQGSGVDVESGSVTVSGADVVLEYNRALPVDPGAVSIVGTDVDLLQTRPIAVDPGSVALTMTAVLLGANRRVPVDPGSVLLAMTDVGLSDGTILTPAPSNFLGPDFSPRILGPD